MLSFTDLNTGAGRLVLIGDVSLEYLLYEVCLVLHVGKYYFLIRIVGGGIQAGSTRHVGH
jgi:hypothetical protein